jgi:RND family efflux transporter MFP subunit
MIMNTNNPLNSPFKIFCCRLLVLAVFTTLLINCSDQNQYIEPPPPDVTVSKPLQQKVTDYMEFTGTTKAIGAVDVRARVSGILESMHFDPGTYVNKGSLLFIIDPKPYQAELAAAEADLVSSIAEYNRAETEYERAEQLIKKGYISKTDHLRRLTEKEVAKAEIGRKKAKVQSARLTLGYTRVTAPISGRVGRNMVDIGNLVGESEATLLTNITQIRPMYAYFHLNERDLLEIMEVRREKVKEKEGHNPEQTPDAELQIPVFLSLANEQNYPHQGILDFAETSVDTMTGTIELRGVFPNAEIPARILPGLFSRLRIPIGNTPDALLVNEIAIGADQGGEFLLLINKENIVEKRPVTTGQTIDGYKVIKTGIHPDDRVIINGLQKARPGGKVNPQDAKTDPAPSSNS